MTDDGKEKKYTIGAFAKLTGVTERALRFYERKQLLSPSGRNPQGHRFYTEQDLLQLQKVLTLKYLDFTLDDISTYLAKPEHNLQHLLDLQFNMLKQKQQQLDKMLETIERLRNSTRGAGKLDSGLLLMFIHNIQNEDIQKQYLLERMPSSIVDAIYQVGVEKEKKSEIEGKMTKLLLKLLEAHRSGKSPTDVEVLELGQELRAMVEEMLGQVISELNQQELKQLEALYEPSMSFDPVLFHNSLNEEEQAFLEKVVEEVKLLKTK